MCCVECRVFGDSHEYTLLLSSIKAIGGETKAETQHLLCYKLEEVKTTVDLPNSRGTLRPFASHHEFITT